MRLADQPETGTASRLRHVQERASLFTRRRLHAGHVTSGPGLVSGIRPGLPGFDSHDGSGGLGILSGTNIILAVNSYVTNGHCAGATCSQRVDLPDILAFINSIP